MKLIVLVVAIAASQATPSNDLLNEKWITFKNNFNKQYSNTVEEKFRFKVFIENLNKIDAHNEKYDKGLVSYALGINQFSDLLNSEFLKRMSCFKNNKFLPHSNHTFFVPENVELDSNVDWRSKGAVTEVKDQQDCGSCWAFSSTGAIEGQNFLQNGKLISLSEQNLVDCNSANGGCSGGLMDLAFEYVMKNKGIDTEESYPYQDYRGACQFDPTKVGAQVYGYKRVTADSEEDLKSAVATVGPIAVAINVDQNLQQYQNGVFDDPSCSKELNHAVLVVGYGTNNNGVDYWIVKNSWGSSWGENGYILMSRNKNNQCGIASYAWYPCIMKLIVFVVAIAATQATPSDDLLNEKWITFKNNFNKQYSNTVEEKFRFKVFMENLNKIDAHNEKYDKGLVSYTLGINQFSDLLASEFLKRTSCFKKINKFLHSNQTFFVPENVELDSHVDWRNKGAVTEVKNQEDCGSCWAFSTTGAIEGQNFLQNGKLISLSEQNLVDCSTANHGCDGGDQEVAFEYVIKNKGIDTEESYPYIDDNRSCRFDKNNVGAKVYGYKRVTAESEDDLKSAVATVGPIAVAVYADIEMQLYKNGIFDNPYCSKELNHAVLVVGYGTNEKGVDYWIVKNSWGSAWGEKGYILMSRNKNNQCGIATDASYPICKPN
ncbi:hypothetical protein RN001_012519 [Aquatica leii]|uniref:Cathepsin L n=1 Tax=Aquatica leii TaxID=1421715 RepID=A0AAN7PUH6_9COLE|nr:hypothetical protein RN001_012519 [Aquatica leii]